MTRLPPQLQQAIDKLSEDRLTGATGCAQAMLACLADLTPFQVITDREVLTKQLEELVQLLAQAKPEMAPLQVIAHRWMSSITAEVKEAQTTDELLAWGEELARQLSTEMEASINAIAQQAADLALEGETILTYSCSGTVKQALLQAHRQKQIRVMLTEGRPKREGRRLAEELAQQGVPVTLGVDAALYQLLKRAEAVWVGADAVMEDSFINKLGTTALAIIAHERRVPFFVLCDPFKYLPEGQAIEIQQNPPAEIYEGKAKLTIENRYFEKVPRSLVTKFISAK